MVRALLWKEWREQAAIVIALLALGGGVIAAAVTFGGQISDASPFWFEGYGQTGRLAFLMLALTAGTVIGGALFAGEDEAGTHEYLNALPTTRARVWRGKVLAGALLAALTGAVLVAEGLLLGALGSGRFAAAWAVWSFVLMLVAFGWGTFGSVIARNTLSACGLGLFTAPLFGTAVLIAVRIAEEVVLQYRAVGVTPPGPALLSVPITAFAMLVAPVVFSGVIYSAPDRARVAHELTPGPKAAVKTVARTVRRTRTGVGGRALLWLAFRQYRGAALILGGIALASGSVFLADDAPLIVGWPSAGLFFGVLAGVIGWADEQGKGAYKFWGERRLPVGRLWLAKVAAGAAFTFGMGVLFLIPAVVQFAATGGGNGNGVGGLVAGVFRSGLLYDAGYLSNHRPEGSPALTYLFLWPVYGFAAGHLCGILFRKAIVAAGVALICGAAMAGLWLPSLFAGGLHGWQLWPVPLVVLLTTRLLLRAWAADRLGTRRPLTALAAGLLLAVGLSAGGVTWRVLEVPEVAGADDDLKFVATLPGFEENPAGRDVRAAAGKFQERTQGLLRSVASPDPLFPDDPQTHYASASGIYSFQWQTDLVLKNGWPDGRRDYADWLTEVFARRGKEDGWEQALLAVADRPLGVVEDPTAITAWTPLRTLDSVRTMMPLFLARGLQLQAGGDPKAFPRYLDAAMAVARNMQNKSISLYYGVGGQIERMALQAFDRWLERLPNDPVALRAALAALQRHEAVRPEEKTWLAARSGVRASVTAPSGWADKYFDASIGNIARRTIGEEPRKARAGLEANLLGFSWAVPWEKERLRRVVGLGNDPTQELRVLELTRGAPQVFDVFHRDPMPDEPAAAARRAAVLRAALRLHQAEKGRLPGKLDELVPAYLPAVPADPFDGKPFRYRVSAGERVKLDYLDPPPEFIPNPRTGPGWELGNPDNLTQSQFDAVAAAAGGAARYPRPRAKPPGLEQPTATDEEFDAVAAAAGGLVQWPLPPLVTEPDGGEPTPSGGGFTPGGVGGVPPVGGELGPRPIGPEYESTGPWESPRRLIVVPPAAPTRRVVDVSAVQGVLWSVGPDGVDDGGTDLAPLPRVRGAVTFGDFVYLVPPPAGPKGGRP